MDGTTDPRLPDLLRPGLAVVFCGTAAGTESARQGRYYAGPGNKFWTVLFAIGLTPRLLQPSEFGELAAFGIGLTDLAKFAAGRDTSLRRTHFDAAAFEARIGACGPRFVAFNGKRAAAEFLNVRSSQIGYGELGRTIGTARLVVLPSTSGAASGFWSDAPWRALAEAVAEDRSR